MSIIEVFKTIIPTNDQSTERPNQVSQLEAIFLALVFCRESVYFGLFQINVKQIWCEFAKKAQTQGGGQLWIYKNVYTKMHINTFMNIEP